MTEQIIGYGGSVEISIDGGTTWANVIEAKGLPVPAPTQEYADATSLDSPDGYREWIKAMKDLGELSLPQGYTSAGYAQMLAANALNGPAVFRVTMALQPSQTTTGDVFEFSGYPAPPALEANDLGAPVGMTTTIRTTGAPTWTAGS